MMGESSVQKVGQKKERSLTASSFHGLLTWLDEGADSDGQKYLEMRRRLVAYFDRKNMPNFEELADETLNRVARRLKEEGAIESDTPAKYCYVVARFVLMEQLREQQKEKAMVEGIGRQHPSQTVAMHVAEQETALKEKMLNCLENCTLQLDPVNHRIITRYYIGKERVKIENRRELATSLGISMNALSIRACRLRDKLEGCVRQCLAK
jgi:DNA-directed RNA polymerase specialized sigma24 family protein